MNNSTGADVAVFNSKSFLDRLRSWSRAELMNPFVFGGNCCSRELARLSGPNPQVTNIREDFIDNKNIESCDVLVVSGVINELNRAYLLEAYQALKSPKFVIAVGMCSASGALFHTTPLSDVLPVDITLGGCPPTLEALKEAVENLRSLVKRGESKEKTFDP